MLDKGGAEGLGEGQLLALLDRPGVERGVTANPGDRELRVYLSGQGGVVLERPRFLPVVAQVDEMEQRIRELAAEGLSMRAVQPRQGRGWAMWGERLMMW